MPDTTSDTRIVSTRNYERRSLDDMFTETAINRTIGEVALNRSRATSTRWFFVSNVIFEAVFDLDIGLISEIVKRIDGLAPAKGDNHGSREIFSDALLDVLDYTHAEQVTVKPDDPAIIALAKATVAIANANVGKNMQARKDRQKAVQMILDRTEGRQSEPAKSVEQIIYESPDWMGLPSGEERHGREEA